MSYWESRPQSLKARLSAALSGFDKDILERFYSLTPDQLTRLLNVYSDSYGDGPVQKELNILKHLLRLAVEWEIIPFHPSQGIKSPRVPAGRVRYLQPAELRAVIQAAPAWLVPIVAIAVSTGMRRSEVLGLRWVDLDLVHGRIMLSQTKNGESRIVYLNKAAQAAIGSLPFDANTKPTDKLFPDITHDQVSTAFRRACKPAEIVDFRFHDLRHTAASWLRMQQGLSEMWGMSAQDVNLRIRENFKTLLTQDVATASVENSRVAETPSFHAPE
jgi:integrase